MVDYNALRKKFPNKDPNKSKRSAAIKAIAREYELKRAELGLKAPIVKRGFAFYGVILIGLLILGASVLTVSSKGGRPIASKADINARASVKALAIALGRYRYHTGAYPTTEEGLEELASMSVAKRGWNGPYIRKVVKDPWKHPYFYASNGDAEPPTVYSKGPDGIGGTDDDILPDPALFEEPFRDTSWTDEWMPQHLRGYVVVPDEETKARLEREIAEVKADNARTGEERARLAATTARAAFLSVGPEAMEVETERFDADGKSRGVRKETLGWGRFPMVSGLGSWNYAEGEKVRVTCSSPGDEVELFVNGESAGRVKRDFDSGLFAWDVVFEPGEIKAIVYRDGSPIGEGWRRTADRPFALRLAAARRTLADGEIGFVKAEVVDGDGIELPSYDGEVEFSVEGPGEILASSRPLQGGAAAVAVRRVFGSGLPVTLHASVKGVRAATLAIPRSAE